MNFAVFNVADIFVTCGILIAVYWSGTKSNSMVVAMNERIVDILVGPEGDGVRLDAFLSCPKIHFLKKCAKAGGRGGVTINATLATKSSVSS